VASFGLLWARLPITSFASLILVSTSHERPKPDSGTPPLSVAPVGLCSYITLLNLVARTTHPVNFLSHIPNPQTKHHFQTPHLQRTCLSSVTRTRLLSQLPHTRVPQQIPGIQTRPRMAVLEEVSSAAADPRHFPLPT
jgi:hypothetical protein